MKKMMILMFGIILLASGCKKEEAKPQVLKGMAIKKITVQGFPSLDNGVNWDVFGANPDIFVQYDKSNTEVYATSYYADATNNNEYSWTDFVYLDDLDNQYSVSLYDYDDVLPHDLMGRVYFYILDQPTSATTLNFDDGPFRFSMEVEFYY